MFYNAVEFEDLKTRAIDNYKKIHNDYHEWLHNKSKEVDGIIERYDLKDKEDAKYTLMFYPSETPGEEIDELLRDISKEEREAVKKTLRTLEVSKNIKFGKIEDLNTIECDLYKAEQALKTLDEVNNLFGKIDLGREDTENKVWEALKEPIEDYIKLTNIIANCEERA